METGEDVLEWEEGARQVCLGHLRGSASTEAPVGHRDQQSSRRKKLRRNVSFPDDANLVRALDPVDPWENGMS